MRKRPAHIDFVAIHQAALPVLPRLLANWLPDGRLLGEEWVARNPTRRDRHAGSFKINVRTGLWADFATGDSGRDVISLYAYLGHLKQSDAALGLAEILRMPPNEVRHD